MALISNLILLVLATSGAISGTGLSLLSMINLFRPMITLGPHILWMTIHGSLALALVWMAQKVGIQTLIPPVHQLVLICYDLTLTLGVLNLILLTVQEFLALVQGNGGQPLWLGLTRWEEHDSPGPGAANSSPRADHPPVAQTLDPGGDKDPEGVWAYLRPLEESESPETGVRGSSSSGDPVLPGMIRDPAGPTKVRLIKLRFKAKSDPGRRLEIYKQEDRIYRASATQIREDYHCLKTQVREDYKKAFGIYRHNSSNNSYLHTRMKHSYLHTRMKPYGLTLKSRLDSLEGIIQRTLTLGSNFQTLGAYLGLDPGPLFQALKLQVQTQRSSLAQSLESMVRSRTTWAQFLRTRGMGYTPLWTPVIPLPNQGMEIPPPRPMGRARWSFEGVQSETLTPDHPPWSPGPQGPEP